MIITVPGQYEISHGVKISVGIEAAFTARPACGHEYRYTDYRCHNLGLTADAAPQPEMCPQCRRKALAETLAQAPTYSGDLYAPLFGSKGGLAMR